MKEEKNVELSENQLEKVGGGTVENDGEKPKIKGLEADIEGSLNIIHYESKAQ